MPNGKYVIDEENYETEQKNFFDECRAEANADDPIISIPSDSPEMRFARQWAYQIADSLVDLMFSMFAQKTNNNEK